MEDKFWNSSTAKIVGVMLRTGNQPGLIAQYKTAMEEWAKANPTEVDAKALLAWLPMFKPRPFYTAAELVPLFPVLGFLFDFTQRIEAQKSAFMLKRELDFANLPMLENLDNAGTHNIFVFRHPLTGEDDHFFIVEQVHYWRKQKMSQAYFAEFF